jgi:hypothetical protein
LSHSKELHLACQNAIQKIGRSEIASIDYFALAWHRPLCFAIIQYLSDLAGFLGDTGEAIDDPPRDTH